MGDQANEQWRLVRQACERAANAYDKARRLVFDVHPNGTPPREELDERQQGALESLERAERDVDELRRSEHDRVDNNRRRDA